MFFILILSIYSLLFHRNTKYRFHLVHSSNVILFILEFRCRTFFSTLCLGFCNCICPIYRNTIILEICQTTYLPYAQCTSFELKKKNRFKLNIMKNSNKMRKSKNIFIGNKFFWSNLSQYVWFYSEIKN